MINALTGTIVLFSYSNHADRDRLNGQNLLACKMLSSHVIYDFLLRVEPLPCLCLEFPFTELYLTPLHDSVL